MPGSSDLIAQLKAFGDAEKRLADDASFEDISTHLAAGIFETAYGAGLKDKKIEVSQTMADFGRTVREFKARIQYYEADIEHFTLLSKLAFPLQDESQLDQDESQLDKTWQALAHIVEFIKLLHADDDYQVAFYTERLEIGEPGSDPMTIKVAGQAFTQNILHNCELLMAALLLIKRINQASQDQVQVLSESSFGHQFADHEATLAVLYPDLPQDYFKKEFGKVIREVHGFATKVVENYLPRLQERLEQDKETLGDLEKKRKALHTSLRTIAKHLGHDGWKDALWRYQALDSRHPRVQRMALDTRDSSAFSAARFQKRDTDTTEQASYVGILGTDEIGQQVTRRPHCATEHLGNTYVLSHATGTSHSPLLERMAQRTAEHASRLVASYADVDTFQAEIDQDVNASLQEGLRVDHSTPKLNAALTVTKLIPSAKPQKTLAVCATRGDCCTLAWSPSQSKMTVLHMPDTRVMQSLPSARHSLEAIVASVAQAVHEVDSDSIIIQLNPAAWRGLHAFAQKSQQGTIEAFLHGQFDEKSSDTPLTPEGAAEELTNLIGRYYDEVRQQRIAYLEIIRPLMLNYIQVMRASHQDALQSHTLNHFKRALAAQPGAPDALAFLMDHFGLSDEASFGQFHAKCNQFQTHQMDTAIQAFRAEVVGPAPRAIIAHCQNSLEQEKRKQRSRNHTQYNILSWIEQEFTSATPKSVNFLSMGRNAQKARHLGSTLAAVRKELGAILDNNELLADAKVSACEKALLTQLSTLDASHHPAYQALANALAKISKARGLYQSHPGAELTHQLWSSAALYYYKKGDHELAKAYAGLATKTGDFIGEFITTRIDHPENLTTLFDGKRSQADTTPSLAAQIAYCEFITGLQALPRVPNKKERLHHHLALNKRALDVTSQYPPLNFTIAANLVRLKIQDVLALSASAIKDVVTILNEAKKAGYHQAGHYLAELCLVKDPDSQAALLIAFGLQKEEEATSQVSKTAWIKLLHKARQFCVDAPHSQETQQLKSNINKQIMSHLSAIEAEDAMGLFDYALSNKHRGVTKESAFAELLLENYQNEELALAFAQQAAVAGDLMGWYILMKVSSQYDLIEVVENIKGHIEETYDNSKQADYVFSLMYEHGIGFARDEERAAEYLLKAIRKTDDEDGLESAQCYYARKLLDPSSTAYHPKGTGLEARYMLANKLLTENAFDGGVVQACQIKAQLLISQARTLLQQSNTSAAQVTKMLMGDDTDPEAGAVEGELNARSYLDLAAMFMDVSAERAQVDELIQTASAGQIQHAKELASILSLTGAHT